MRRKTANSDVQRTVEHEPFQILRCIDADVDMHTMFAGRKAAQRTDDGGSVIGQGVVHQPNPQIPDELPLHLSGLGPEIL